MFKLPNYVKLIKCSPSIFLYHHTRTSSSLPYVVKKYENSDWRKRTWGKRLVSLGVLMGFSYYFYKEKFGSCFPKIYAASFGSRRAQFNFIADVVDSSAKSVVFIEIVDNRRLDFFTGSPKIQANGSGFIVKEDGLILTNAHVVMSKPNSAVNVRLQDGTSYTGVVEDVDMHWDLATVRIRPKFGNSGGPLVNLDGEAIGINAMKLTTGISFAIPIEYAKEFLKRIDDKKKGIISKVSENPRRYMGITMLSLTPQIIGDLRAKKKSIPNEITQGVFVWKVVVGSPAHSGGIMPGDIITTINGESVVGASTVYKVMESNVPLLKMEVYRNGDKLRFSVTPEVST